MKRLLAAWAFLAGLGAIALLFARFVEPGRFELELDVYILGVGGLALLMIVIGTREAYPRAKGSALADAMHHEPARALRPPELERLEREVTLGTSTAYDLHFRLRPALREIARERLAVGRGLRLDAGGPAVEEALGEELWELVQPRREPPILRYGPGISREGVHRIVERLEAL